MTYEEALAWIHGRLKFGSRPGLTRINALLDRLDHPENSIRTVHVGGTNGKGSTVTFLRCLLEEQGLRVGTFTSPYIECFNERMAINGRPIPDEDLIDLVAYIKPLVEEMDQDDALKHTTEFEIITAMSFCYFLAEDVDIAIIEVGLGGTYDCTNVITPLVSVITTIGMDHMDILGDTIELIAEQKAGIIKPGVPVVTGNIQEEALRVIKDAAQKQNSSFYGMFQDYTAQYKHPANRWGEVFDFHNREYRLTNLETAMIGRHQTENAATAIETYLLLSELLSYSVSRKDIAGGLRRALWPGRMERLSEEPLIVLDGAHNEPAVERLVDNLRSEFGDKDIYVIFGALLTKDVGHMLARLSRLPNVHLYLSAFDYPKARQAQDYEGMPYPVYDSWQQAAAAILPELSQDDMLLVTGSLYFISQVRHYLTGGEMIAVN